MLFKDCNLEKYTILVGFWTLLLLYSYDNENMYIYIGRYLYNKVLFFRLKLVDSCAQEIRLYPDSSWK